MLEMRAESHILRWMKSYFIEVLAWWVLAQVAVLFLAEYYGVPSMVGNIISGVVLASGVGMVVVFYIAIAMVLCRPGATRSKYANLTADEKTEGRRSCYLFIVAVALASAIAAFWSCIG